MNNYRYECVSQEELDQRSVKLATSVQREKINDLTAREWRITKLSRHPRATSSAIAVSLLHPTGTFVVIAPDGSMRRPDKNKKTVRWNWDEFDLLAQKASQLTA